MRRIPILLAATSAAACGTAGAFHQASLFRECRGGANDCKSLAPSAPLAVGARLRPAVEIDLAGTATPDVKVSSGRPDIIADDGDVLRGVAPGVTPILITADDGTVIDFVHVWVAAPTRLAVDAAPARGDALEEVTAPIQLVAGESRWLEPAVFGGAQRLAGAGDIAWHVECDGVPAPGAAGNEGTGSACAQVALLTDGAPDRRRLVARTPGTARIALDGLGLHTTVDVEVVP